MRFSSSRMVGVVLAALVATVASGCASTDSRESTGQYIDSSIVTTAVKAALAADELTSLLDIEVETFRDVVQLSGFVDSDAARLQAGAVAADVEGVKEVRNDLIVKPAS